MTRSLLFAIIITLSLSFFRLGAVKLFDVDEAVFAQATKEMVTTGDFITPTYNGNNRYDKPIFFYWMMAFCYKIFGISEFSARVPSAFSGFLLCMAIFFFVKHLRDEKNAFYAVLVFALSLYFLIYSHAAVTDMSLTLFLTLSLFSFYLSVADKGFPEKKALYMYGFYAFSAIAFLTKGLIGIVFPFGIALMYVLITKEPGALRKLFNLKGWGLFFIIAAPWFTAESFINGWEFFQQFIIKHHFMRYTGSNSGHGGPFYYYLPVLLIGLFPWISFLPAGIRNALKERDSLGLFALIWFLFILAFFSISTTKLPNYILPSIPAAVLLISSGISLPNLWRRYAQILLSLLSLLIGIACVIAPQYLLKKEGVEANWLFAIALTAFFISALGVIAFYSRKVFIGYVSALMVPFLFILSLKALPLANDSLQGTLYRYSLLAKHTLPDDGQLITYKINNPSIVFYSGHKITEIKNGRELRPLLEGKRSFVAIARARDARIFEDAGLSVRENDGKYILIEKQ